jgi:hypothetical protein
MSLLINKAIEEHFHLEEMANFMHLDKKDVTEYGYIPTEQKSSVLKSLRENRNKIKRDKNANTLSNKSPIIGKKLLGLATKK